MRSLSTRAFGQPSETKLTLGARAASRFSFSMGEGLPDREGGSKRSVLGPDSFKASAHTSPIL